MNAQHSANTGEWYTPAEWIALVRAVLGSIDFDPCSSEAANGVVGAGMFCDRDSLVMPWHEIASTVFVNPPGCCRRGFLGFSVCGNAKNCGCRLPRRFLEKTIAEAALGVNSIYLAYSVNQLRQLSSIAIPRGLALSVALPAKRIPYLDPKTMQPKRGTNCDSAFVLVSDPVAGTSHKLFADVFGSAPETAITSPSNIYTMRSKTPCLLP